MQFICGIRPSPLHWVVIDLQAVSMFLERFNSRGSLCDDPAVKQGFPCKATAVYHPAHGSLCYVGFCPPVTKVWHVSVMRVSVGRWDGERAVLATHVSEVNDSLAWEGHSATVNSSFTLHTFSPWAYFFSFHSQ